MARLKKRERQPVVHYPAALEHSEKEFRGTLYGLQHPESNEHNIIAYGLENNDYPPLGVVVSDHAAADVGDDQIVAYWKNDELQFKKGDRSCEKKPYELIQNIFSRNSGILETAHMLDKKVIIVGCGSVGSFVALELARSGVGSFLLVDNDTLAYHNLCRHQCGLEDVGKFKVNALKQRIQHINPTVIIETHQDILETVSKTTFDAFCTPDTIIIGCADNREGDLYGNKIAHLYKIPFVSIGFWERASAGEVFHYNPEKTPCYHCLFGSSAFAALTQRESTNRRHYTTAEDLSKANFEPGISTDIVFVTTIGVKLVLDLLNQTQGSYTPALLGYLSPFTLVCNNNNPEVGGELVEIFSHPLQVTTSIDVNRDPHCEVCGTPKPEDTAEVVETGEVA